MNFTETRGLESQITGQTSPVSTQHFTYDQDDRLTTVQDSVSTGQATTCATRQYAFDADSNRTSLAAYAAGNTGACSTSTAPTTVNSTYDQADRITNAGYAYDAFGRTTTVPAVDAAGVGQYASDAGNLTVGYYSNDMVNTETQGAGSLSYGLDPEQDRIATTVNGATTTTNHYSGDSDSPTWSSTGGSNWNRSLDGIDGGYAASEDQTGAVTLELANMHGDIVATALDATTDTGIQTGSYNESTEYGIDRTASTGSTSYGWLGSQKRSDNSLSGLVLMGVRLYDPNTGRFLSTDPIYGGNSNPYVYPADPIGASDVSGKDESNTLKNTMGEGRGGGSEEGTQAKAARAKALAEQRAEEERAYEERSTEKAKERREAAERADLAARERQDEMESHLAKRIGQGRASQDSIDQTIERGSVSKGRNGTRIYTARNLRVIVNMYGDVITVTRR
ncbi:RHS repeat-associated core domain-containing protein [Frondihabitans sp. PAMC 28766]|uniref:RHS repeat-associated core domain-containing protein n=1 Tax=Frondihabitans sp. PAMC 28766 TaxID=1795630 RepID=UPI0012FF8F66|nr:RHS repeat-associated core domain-containing protein [Frondihabitans sp. PAMC 28766]